MSSENGTELQPLPPDLVLDWQQVRLALTRQGEPDRVPFLEAGLSRVHKRRVLGRPVRTLADDLEVAGRIGQPFLVANLGLQTTDAVLAAMDATHVEIEDGRDGDVGWVKGSERRWAHGTVGAIRSEADLDAFPWPTLDSIDFGILDQMQALLPEGFKVIVAVGKVFNLGWWLMGFDTYAYTLADNPGLVERLHARIAEFQTRTVERALEYPCVGLVWHADDMAYRTGLMVSPDILRKHVFPVYRRITEMCHQQDVLTVFHSDGNVERLMEDIIAAGFDAFNPIEPVAMDIRQLKRQVQGRLSLIGNVDLSYTLTRGTPAEVRNEVRALMRDVAPGGGYALASANSIPEYVPWENFVAMHAAWLEYGRYPIRA
jgi:uroporphyrinogen decarboxylase